MFLIGLKVSDSNLEQTIGHGELANIVSEAVSRRWDFINSTQVVFRDVENANDLPQFCHCGDQVWGSLYENRGVDLGPPSHALCSHCLPFRCDAYPGECGR